MAAFLTIFTRPFLCERAHLCPRLLFYRDTRHKWVRAPAENLTFNMMTSLKIFSAIWLYSEVRGFRISTYDFGGGEHKSVRNPKE